MSSFLAFKKRCSVKPSFKTRLSLQKGKLPPPFVWGNLKADYIRKTLDRRWEGFYVQLPKDYQKSLKWRMDEYERSLNERKRNITIV